MPSRSGSLLKQVLKDLGLDTKHCAEQWPAVYEIVRRLGVHNSKSTLAAATTGALTEALCSIGLRSVLDEKTRDFWKLGKDWKWLADFAIRGRACNVLISVKSFTAKERLLMSGTGSALAPTIGFGLFKEPKEWSEQRAMKYLLRGFWAIYMPKDTLKRVPPHAKQIRNPLGGEFLRELTCFPTDILQAWDDPEGIDPLLL